MSLSHIKNTTIARIVETVYYDVTYYTFLIRQGNSGLVMGTQSVP